MSREEEAVKRVERALFEERGKDIPDELMTEHEQDLALERQLAKERKR